MPGVGAEFVSDRIATPFFPMMFVNSCGLDLGYAIAMSAQAAVSACARDLQVPGPVLIAPLAVVYLLTKAWIGA